jgi:Na+-transporting methylmalonyl-CoA/oxaloacetate decarboxylase gamma subunit
MLTLLLPQVDSLTMAHSADMATKDPHGILLTLTSVTIVFLVIVSLIFAYSLIGKLLNRQSRPDKEERKNGPSEKEAAAIALALELHMKKEQHDDESYVITIKR